MKKFKKKMIIATMCIGLTLGFGISSVAAQNESNSIVPLAQECGNCGRYSISTSLSYSSWRDTGRTVTCKKYVLKRDIIQVRDIYTKYSCSYCGYNQTVTTQMERVVCNH